MFLLPERSELMRSSSDKRTKACSLVVPSMQISWRRMSRVRGLQAVRRVIQIADLTLQQVISCLPVVIVPEIILGSFLMSSKHAIGIPQFATGPQKWVLQWSLSKSEGRIARRNLHNNLTSLSTLWIAETSGFQATSFLGGPSRLILWFLALFTFD